jgi:hypothetical protein
MEPVDQLRGQSTACKEFVRSSDQANASSCTRACVSGPRPLPRIRFSVGAHFSHFENKPRSAIIVQRAPEVHLELFSIAS